MPQPIGDFFRSTQERTDCFLEFDRACDLNGGPLRVVAMAAWAEKWGTKITDDLRFQKTARKPAG